MKVLKREKIKKEIKSVTSEIEDLQSRLASIENNYKHLKEKSDFDKARDELHGLKADRDLLNEIIEEKQGRLESLNSDLEKQSAVENRKQTIQELIDFAKKAEQLEESYHQKMSALDDLLQESIPEIIQIRNEWEKTAKRFMDLGDSSDLGKGLKAGSSFSLARNGRNDEIMAKHLLEELEDLGANTRPVTSGRVLSSQHFTNISNPREIDLTFGENLNAMMRQSNARQFLQKA